MTKDLEKYLASHGCFCGGDGVYTNYNCGVSFRITCPHCKGSGNKICGCETVTIKCSGGVHIKHLDTKEIKMPEVFNNNAAPRVWELLKKEYFASSASYAELTPFVKTRLKEMLTGEQISEDVLRQVTKIADTLDTAPITDEDQRWLWEIYTICYHTDYILSEEEIERIQKYVVYLYLVNNKLTAELSTRLVIMLANQCIVRNTRS